MKVTISLDYSTGMYDDTRDYKLVLSCLQCGVDLKVKIQLTGHGGLWHPTTYQERVTVDKQGRYKLVDRKSICPHAGKFVKPPIIELEEIDVPPEV